jgi:hypothetical protein
MNTPQTWSATTLHDGTFSVAYEGRGLDNNGRWLLFENVKKLREAERLLIEAAPLMLAALQRITHPAADDTDLGNALQVIAQATQEPKQ